MSGGMNSKDSGGKYPVFRANYLLLVVYALPLVFFGMIAARSLDSLFNVKVLINPFGILILFGVFGPLVWMIWLLSLRVTVRDDCLVVRKIFEKMELNYHEVKIVNEAKSIFGKGGTFLFCGSEKILDFQYIRDETGLKEIIEEKRREYIQGNPEKDFKIRRNPVVKKTKSVSMTAVSIIVGIPIYLFVFFLIYDDVKDMINGKSELPPSVMAVIMFVVIAIVFAVHKKKIQRHEKKIEEVVSGKTELFSGNLSEYEDEHIVEVYEHFYENPDDPRGEPVFAELVKRGLAEESDLQADGGVFIMKDGYSYWENIKAERIKLARKFIYVVPKDQTSLFTLGDRMVIRIGDITSARMVKKFEVLRMRREDVLEIRFTKNGKKDYVFISAKDLEGWVRELKRSGVPVKVYRK